MIGRAILLLFLPLSAQAAVFGADNRQDVTPLSAFALVGRATAVAVLSSNIEPSAVHPGTLKLNASALDDGFVCPDERFAADPSLQFACSGFLVAPDLLVTAGHCMVNTGESKDETGMYCSVYGWLFGYRKGADGKALLDGIPPSDYYKCKKIIYAVRDERAPFRDYALVRLERPVTGAAPFSISPDQVHPADLLSMIGFPFGTPMKVSPYARVSVSDPSRQSFLTNLDAFEGNSGSVVFNQQHQAVGILVGGTPSKDTFTDPVNQCERYNHCDASGNNCAAPDLDTSLFPGYQGVGSEVQRIAPIADLLKTLPR